MAGQRNAKWYSRRLRQSRDRVTKLAFSCNLTSCALLYLEFSLRWFHATMSDYYNVGALAWVVEPQGRLASKFILVEPLIFFEGALFICNLTCLTSYAPTQCKTTQ